MAPNPKIFDQLITSEMLLSQLYTLLANVFPEDEELWLKLGQEEKGHAAILSSGKEILVKEDLFPLELLKISRKDLDSSNKRKEKLITTLNSETKYLTRDTAMNTAIELEENDPVEKLFQNLMEKSPEREDLKIFQKLNGASTDHANRLKKYHEQFAG